jgi:NDP-sugar pyrophosphorylase family protein
MDPFMEVVILAGGECKRLYPLTSGGVVKALLPVGNRPLISFPLRHLAEAGIKSAIVVRSRCPTQPHRQTATLALLDPHGAALVAI